MNLERIVQNLHPGGQLLRVWQPEGGVSAEIMALEIATLVGGTTKYILRRHGEADLAGNPDVAAMEFSLLHFLQGAGIPAPKPCFLDISCKILPTPYLVVEFIEGAVDFSPTDLSSYLQKVSTQLAAIHSMDITRVDLSYLPKQELRLIQSRRSAVGNQVPGLDLEQIQDILVSAWPSMTSKKHVMLHGDYWPGNILWQEGGLAAVIDWENAVIGEPLADLANSRLEVLWAFGLDALQAFTRSYQEVREIETACLSYWDLWAVLKPAAKMWTWGLSPGKEREMVITLKWFAKEALSKVSV